MSTVLNLLWAGSVASVGYITQAFKILNVKYYVSQQLAQMQAHNLNRDILIARAESGGMKKIVNQLFKDYDKDIKADNWCWVKVKDKIMCVPIESGRLKSKRKGIPGIEICTKERHNGIFPPIASIANALDPCTVDSEILEKNRLSWVDDWKKTLQGYATGYISNLEFYVLQLEAIEQDLTLNLLKV